MLKLDTCGRPLEEYHTRKMILHATYHFDAVCKGHYTNTSETMVHVGCDTDELVVPFIRTSNSSHSRLPFSQI